MNNKNDEIDETNLRNGQVPAVPIAESVTLHYLICLEDGRPMKMLKHHLAEHHNLTPQQYRQKWGLPPDYPMAAPGYLAEVRARAARPRQRTLRWMRDDWNSSPGQVITLHQRDDPEDGPSGLSP